MRVVRFGDGSRVYVFPQEEAAYSTNFSNVVPSTSRLPGVSGGFDELGDDAAPSEIGNVNIDFTLVAQEREDMEAKRDAVKAMAGWGLQKLYVRPLDPLLPERWTYARVNSISIPERLDKHTDLHQFVSVKFQVASSRWFSIGTESPVWGGFNWDDGTVWGGDLEPILASGLETDTVVEVGGNADNLVRAVIRCGVGQSVTNPTIQRIVNGVVVDEVSYTGTLSAGDTLEINARAYSVTKNGVDAYTSSFSMLSADWLKVLPGENNIRIVFDNVSDAASVYLRYYEAFY